MRRKRAIFFRQIALFGCGESDGPDPSDDKTIPFIKGSNVQVLYSDVQGGFPGEGNLEVDPLFVTTGNWADPNTYVLGDCHLKSQAGHWNPRTCSWVLDDATSPCIDDGDPNSPLGHEALGPYGTVVDMGVYGGTMEASRTIVE